ncbi:MAG TPA: sulfatase [Rubrobacteraceae bacterium]|nr:sulfatase [Rubrobacteraceae bacterium]
MLAFAVLLLMNGGTASESALAHEVSKPNIILILTDDMRADDLKFTPRTQNLLGGGGVTFKNAFVTDSICCPSRSTILRGQYAHNHSILSNHYPLGSGIKFRELGRDNSTVATWLHSSGYRTGLFGTYLKFYDGSYVPPGWDDWYGWMGSNQFNENGQVIANTSDIHITDRLSNRADAFVRQGVASGEPFFAYIAPTAPHPPAIPPDRYKDAYPNLVAPRDASFNERDVSDKMSWVRNHPLLTANEMSGIDSLYRNRARSLLAVDDMVERLVNTLTETGALENTYIVFTSDNGFHMGEHRLPPMKQTAYEEDIRVPLLIRGPGLPAGESRTAFALNNDFAPTFADWADASVPISVDGRSLSPILSSPLTTGWRTSFLVEKWDTNAMPQSYKAVRTADWTYVRYSNGEKELYNLSKDPQELRNVAGDTDEKTLHALDYRLDTLKACKATTCRSAENRP